MCRKVIKYFTVVYNTNFEFVHSTYISYSCSWEVIMQYPILNVLVTICKLDKSRKSKHLL